MTGEEDCHAAGSLAGAISGRVPTVSDRSFHRSHPTETSVVLLRFVAVTPGQTALHLMPFAPKVAPILRVSPRRPDLAAEYAAPPRAPRRAATEAMLTITPELRSIIPGRTAWHSKNGAVRLMARRRS